MCDGTAADGEELACGHFDRAEGVPRWLIVRDPRRGTRKPDDPQGPEQGGSAALGEGAPW